VNYQSIGSGGGIRQIIAKTVTFGASDMPLKAEQLKKDGLIQFPTVMGGVVPIINVRGIKTNDIVFDGPTLSAIFMGKVTRWDDSKIKSLNVTVTLPSLPIAVVHRSEGSGTTFLFTDYLSKVNDEWKSKVGTNTSVEWQTGIGAKGNEGVANNVMQTRGSIGYVEYAYAKQNRLPIAKLVNKDGKIVAANADSFRAAAANANWDETPGFGVVSTNEPGAGSWPLAGATFILMQVQPQDVNAAREAIKFFAWTYAKGGSMAEELDYVPMPDKVVSSIKRAWSEIKDMNGKPIFPVP
jgi:phosphate transport system substrate-binding protein